MRFALTAAAAALLITGCSHTKQAEKKDPTEETTIYEKKPTRADEAPLTSAPRGLLEGDGAQRIQKALADKGFSVKTTGKLDTPTRDALLKFQAKNDLPETGMPDRETLRRLGVDPEEVLKSREKKPDKKSDKN